MALVSLLDHCSRLPVRSLSPGETLIDEGVRCPRKVLIRSDTHLIPQQDPRWLDNVNTPDDLAGSVLEARA